MLFPRNKIKDSQAQSIRQSVREKDTKRDEINRSWYLDFSENDLFRFGFTGKSLHQGKSKKKKKKRKIAERSLSNFTGCIKGFQWEDEEFSFDRRGTFRRDYNFDKWQVNATIKSMVWKPISNLNKARVSSWTPLRFLMYNWVGRIFVARTKLGSSLFLWLSLSLVAFFHRPPRATSRSIIDTFSFYLSGPIRTRGKQRRYDCLLFSQNVAIINRTVTSPRPESRKRL